MEETDWDHLFVKIEGVRGRATIRSTEIDEMAEEWEAAAHAEAEQLLTGRKGQEELSLSRKQL